MKIRYLFLLFAFCLNTAWADFSEAVFRLHPMQPREGEPYLIEITGEWPGDCHPGEQKPVVRDYTGDTAIVEFETIVEHITCNDVATPYRVLVDMSDVIDSVTGAFQKIAVTLRFGEAEFTRILDLACMCTPVPVGPHINPEAGLYENKGFAKQGLLLARQNDRMAVYPLIYDESGSSEWLFGGGGIVEDVYFTALSEFTGGHCLDCLPLEEPTQMDVVGKLTMLMDSEGVIQVKVNDGLFETYEPLNFGYEQVNIGGNPIVRIPDLSGRWAFIDGDTEWGTGTPPPTAFMPLVFDIILQPPPTIGIPPATPQSPSGNASYLIRDMEGETVAEMRCEFMTAMVCKWDNPENPDGFAVRLLSPERMILTNLSPITLGGIGTGTAVRID